MNEQFSYEGYMEFCEENGWKEYIESWENGVITFNSGYGFERWSEDVLDIRYLVYTDSDNQFEEPLNDELKMINFLADRLEPDDIIKFYNYKKLFLDCGECKNDVCGLPKFSNDGCCQYVFISRKKEKFTPEILEYIEKVEKGEIKEVCQEFFLRFAQCYCGECTFCTDVRPMLYEGLEVFDDEYKLICVKATIREEEPFDKVFMTLKSKFELESFTILYGKIYNDRTDEEMSKILGISIEEVKEKYEKNIYKLVDELGTNLR